MAAWAFNNNTKNTQTSSHSGLGIRHKIENPQEGSKIRLSCRS